MSSACHIFCAKCLEPVELTIDATWLATVACPSCGESDAFSAAADEASAEFADRLACEAGRGEARGPETSRSRRYRFVFAFSPR